MRRLRTPEARALWTLAFPSVLLLTSCATPDVGETINTQTHDTIYFELSKPSIYLDPSGFRIVGSACRGGPPGLLSPEYVRIEHLTPNGEIIDHVRAYLPEITLRSDQRCSSYSVTVPWKFQASETVNVCFERGKPCPPARAQAARAAP